jgi:protocatechuate 3,4-dioxygenase beta subunit
MTTNRHIPTAEEMVGPYYPPAFLDADRHDLSRWDGLSVVPDGEVIVLTGTIRDIAGRPVAPILVEYWQADAEGRYAPDAAVSPWFDGLGRQYSDDGVYRLTTVRPGRAGGRASHVTVTLFCDGLSRLVTQIFFDDDPALAGDPLLRSMPAELGARLIATRQAGGDRPVYRRDIILNGADETPFFDTIGEP